MKRAGRPFDVQEGWLRLWATTMPTSSATRPRRRVHLGATQAMATVTIELPDEVRWRPCTARPRS